MLARITDSDTLTQATQYCNKNSFYHLFLGWLPGTFLVTENSIETDQRNLCKESKDANI